MRWKEAYGLEPFPPFAGDAERFHHFREAAINMGALESDSDSAISAQCFEITAAGGFLLTYDHPVLASHFDVGKECDTFADEHELLEKVRYYLEHPERRVEIAHAGQQRSGGDSFRRP